MDVLLQFPLSLSVLLFRNQVLVIPDVLPAVYVLPAAVHTLHRSDVLVSHMQMHVLADHVASQMFFLDFPVLILILKHFRQHYEVL